MKSGHWQRGLSPPLPYLQRGEAGDPKTGAHLLVGLVGTVDGREDHCRPPLCGDRGRGQHGHSPMEHPHYSGSSHAHPRASPSSRTFCFWGARAASSVALCRSSAMGKPLPVPPGGDGGHGELAQSQARGQGRANPPAANAACSRAADAPRRLAPSPASLPSPSPTSASSRSPGARRGQLKHLGLFSCLPKLGGLVPINACLEKSSKKETPAPRCVFSVLLEPCPHLFYQNSEPISWDPSVSPASSTQGQSPSKRGRCPWPQTLGSGAGYGPTAP